MRVQQGESLVQILETPATKQQVKDHLFFTYSKFSEKVIFYPLIFHFCFFFVLSTKLFILNGSKGIIYFSNDRL